MHDVGRPFYDRVRPAPIEPIKRPIFDPARRGDAALTTPFVDASLKAMPGVYFFIKNPLRR